MVRVLIIEDDKAINDLICMNFSIVGYECRQVYDGNIVQSALCEENYDIVILDVMLPGIDGFELMKMGVFKDIPVIFVTAKECVDDRVKGLKLGADDYIVKPFESSELLARTEAVLRRTNKDKQVYTIDDTVIYLDRHVITVKDKEIELTNREFMLLETLLINCNIALSREKLLNLVWGFDYYGDTRTLDVHITKLRKKLHFENRIKTVFKLGYRLEV